LGGLLGAGILWVVLLYLSPLLRENQLIEAPTTYWGASGLNFLSAVGSVILAVFVIFIGRLITAPARIYAELKATIPPVLKSDIDLAIDNIWAFETITVDADGHKLPHARLLCVRVSNAGDKFLQKCQITFGPKGCHNPVSGYFDLRRGESKSVPVLRMNCNSKDPRPFLYFLRDTDWQIEAGGPKSWPNPGIYEIIALSADTHPATLGVKLSQTNENWELTECG
jgi:hypothetical protein